MKDHESFVGWDGWLTLSLAILFMLVTAGLSYLFALVRVVYLAVTTPIAPPFQDVMLVLGSRLRENTITADYAIRLRRAIALFDNGKRILLVGGTTHDNRTSEATEGRRFLIAGEIPQDRIILEDTSRHTLENLHRARDSLKGLDPPGIHPCLLITSRYHLARAHAMAAGLDIPHVLCAAEDSASFSPSYLLKFIQDAFYLHWYWVGKAWSHLVRSDHSLKRIK